MAGIGFRLQRILREDSYRSVLAGYVYSAVVSTGPWLLAIIALLVLAVAGRMFLAVADVSLFQCVVTYTYVGTLLLTGALQMGTTRHVADRLFVGDVKALLPCYHWVSLWVTLAGGALAGGFFFLAGLAPAEALAAVVLFQAVCLTWLGMIFLSAAKDYMALVRAFALGYALGVVAALLGARLAGLAGTLWGFTLGQAALATLLAVRIRVEFPAYWMTSNAVRQTWRAVPMLAVIGFFYNAGIWTDKLVFWFSGQGECLRGWFYAAPRYDVCVYLAYLSIVPAMALFLIRVETAFYKHYAAFYEAVTQGRSLATIREQKLAMMESLRVSAERLLQVQGGVTLAGLIGAPLLLRVLGLAPDLLPMLRLCLLAALAQALLMILLIVLLYFDWQRPVAILAILFSVLNPVLSWVSLALPDQYYGSGYFLACLATLVPGLMVLERRMQHLERETFTSQPFLT